MSTSSKAGDEHLGLWVYCNQHCRVHATGWCTVDPTDKVALESKIEEDAVKEAESKGLVNYQLL